MTPRDLPEPRVLADADALSLRFPDAASLELALGLLARWAPDRMPEREDEACGTLGWDVADAFDEAREELDDLGFLVRFPRAQRLARLAALPVGPYAAVLLRGQRPMRQAGYASDPGDLGCGRYLTSCPVTAATYGVVSEHRVAFGRVAFATQGQASGLAGGLYRTCRGRDRVGGADTLRADFLSIGVEALVVDGYDCRPGHATVVDFTSAPPRPLVPWDEFEIPEPAPLAGLR